MFNGTEHFLRYGSHSRSCRIQVSFTRARLRKPRVPSLLLRSSCQRLQHALRLPSSGQALFCSRRAWFVLRSDAPFVVSSFRLLLLHAPWLSKSPEESLLRNSPAWNTSKIHHVGAPNGVVNAYVAQFEKDMEIFLSARAKEVVPGGMVAILAPGTREGFVTGVAIVIAFFGCILMEMVQEGHMEQDQVDTFNLPNLYPSIKEMTKVVESNGSFSIEKMELMYIPIITTPADTESVIVHSRAAMEGTFAKHFGSHIADEMFKRAVQQKEKLNDQLFSSGVDNGALLLTILKRK